MSALNQVAAVSAMNLRSLPHRIGTSSVVVIGIAGVVAVLISVLAMSTGFIRTLENTGPENRAIVVRTGSSTELVSVMTNDAALTIADSAGIKKGGDGRPLASPETLLLVNLSKKDGEDASAPFRGLTQDGFAVHPEIKLNSGRMFQPGVNEMIVGKSAQRLYKGLDVDSQIKLFGATWTVVGTFESSGTGRESELVADKQTVNSAYQRGNGEQSVWVVLDGSAGFQAFKDSVTTNPQLQVEVATEKDYGAQQAATISKIL
jgi:putative ABC transport system permease protein